jgi:hypothetical protein
MVIPRRAIARTQSWMAAHMSPEQVVYRGLGHDVAGPEVTDFITFVDRQLRRGHRPLRAGATRSTADGEQA